MDWHDKHLDRHHPMDDNEGGDDSVAAATDEEESRKDDDEEEEGSMKAFPASEGNNLVVAGSYPYPAEPLLMDTEVDAAAVVVVGGGVAPAAGGTAHQHYRHGCCYNGQKKVRGQQY